ncbi:MAG: MotA/TolQ/ExbB proton channel family protein [Desulfobacterium sp.]|jgi:chemotaxis protein MotA|nr:MotA/TolQ/ExbB proton channel family protein [Desulfobacterium sp.]
MDLASIIGIVSGLGFVSITILLGSGLGLFWNLPSVMVVGGGTIAATMIAFPLSDFLSIIKVTMRVFLFKIDKTEEIIANLVEISNKARKGGLLSIEGDIANTEDPYLAKALQMTVDGVKTADIAAIMQKKMSLIKREHKIGYSIYSAMGSFAPAFGMVGTLIGLVQMLANLDDPSTIGPKMAVAMITTFYGSLLANLFFIPMATKLEGRSAEELMNMTLIYEGVVSIREGEHPRLMEDKLNIYLGAGAKPREE